MEIVPRSTVLTWAAHPILAAADRRIYVTPFAERETISGYLNRIGIGDDVEGVLTISGEYLPRHLWSIARPKIGTIITLRSCATGGDKSNPIAVVAMIALAIIAPYAGGWIAEGINSGLGLGLGATGLHILTSVASSAVLLAGGLLINSLFAPPVSQISDARLPDVSPTYSLSGGKNIARHFGPLPLVLGKHRIYPDVASAPYTEFAGDDQYLIQIFNFGYGRLFLSGGTIGQTPILSFTDQIREDSGIDGDGTLYKFPGNVDSISGGILGSGTPAVNWPAETDDTAYIVRTSGINAIKLAVDIEASIYAIGPQGLLQWSLHMIIEYRVPGGTWQKMVVANTTSEVAIGNGTEKPVRRTYFSSDLSPGQYEVRVKRRYGENVVGYEPTKFFSSASWTTLRTYQLDTTSYEQQRRYGIWMKASGQINGIMDRVSAIAETEVQTWNGSAWVAAYSSNPAWIFLYFARGGFSSTGRLLWGAGLPDARIDIETIKLWGVYCTTNALTCNMIIDVPMSVAEVLNAITRCGRASVSWASGKLGVVWDDENAPVIAQFGMSSIKAGSFSIEWASSPLAEEIVVQFADEAVDYEQSEVRVLAPNVTTPTRTDTVQWLGCTNQTMAGKMANLLMANNVYRSRKIIFETDAEGLVVARGDRIMLSHDLTQWGYSGRLTGATTTRLDLDREIPRVLGTQAWIALVKPDGMETFNALTDVATGNYSYVNLSTPLSAANVPGTAYPESPLCDWKWRFDFRSTPGKRVKVAALEPLGERSIRLVCVDDPDEYHAMSVRGYTYIGRSARQPATPTVSGLMLSEALVNSGGVVTVKVIATWHTTGEVGVTRVRWHDGDGIWIPIGDVAGRRAEIIVQERTTVTVEVSVLNGLGQLGPNGVATANHYVIGKTEPPPDPQYLLVSGQGDGTRQFSFGYTTSATPVDLAGWKLRYVSGSSGTWDSMTDLHAGLLTVSPWESNNLSAGTWTFGIKAIDNTGNESLPLYATATLLDPRMGSVIYEIDPLRTGWPGTKTNSWVDPVTGWLECNSTDTWADLPPWESWNKWTSNPVTSMSYEHSVIDIGTVAPVKPSASCVCVGSVAVEEAHSNDGVTYSSWAATGVQVTGRYFKVRATLTPSESDQVMRLESMRIMLDAKTIEEWVTDSATSTWSGTTGDRRIPISKTYAVIQQVQITLQSVGAGWSWELIDKSTTLGPRIKIYNASNVLTDAVVDAYLKGL